MRHLTRQTEARYRSRDKAVEVLPIPSSIQSTAIGQGLSPEPYQRVLCAQADAAKRPTYAIETGERFRSGGAERLRATS
jgi:hypothetical protein